MKFETSDIFKKQLKKLAKKYSHIKHDIENFIQNFEFQHKQAVKIKNNLYKIRIKNSDKTKGKRGGYRVYYYLKMENKVILLVIYDKGEIEMINEKLLKELIELYK
jgi:mRNA-degrading endonuclease RelE of RelBE toxin-antitoxin system